MKHYLVVGIDDADGQVISAKVQAGGPHAAIAIVAERHRGEDAQILGATEVAADYDPMTAFIPACEDSGKAAYLADLLDDEQELCECGREPSICTQGECDCEGCHDNDEDCDAMKQRLGIDNEEETGESPGPEEGCCLEYQDAPAEDCI